MERGAEGRRRGFGGRRGGWTVLLGAGEGREGGGFGGRGGGLVSRDRDREGGISSCGCGAFPNGDRTVLFQDRTGSSRGTVVPGERKFLFGSLAKRSSSLVPLMCV